MSAIRNMVLDAGGRLMKPGFHDGRLTSITVSEDSKTASIGLLRFSGEPFLLRLFDVELLLATEFRQGNIVLDVVLANGIEPRDMAAFRRLVGEPRTDVAVSLQERSEANIARRLRDVVEGRSVFAQIEASYGCDLACLCGSAEMIAVGE
jgi:hypothetical protein